MNLLWLIPALGAVTLLYMLRRPRREIVVPSTSFWRMMPQETVRVQRLQKLTPQILFFLQLLAAALLVFAAASPQVTRLSAQRQSWTIILDNGVTMQSRDVSGGLTRFSVAKQQASQLIRAAAGANAVVSVVATAPPRLLISPTASQASLLQAVESTTATDMASDLAGASLIAAAAQQANSSKFGATRKTIIISDGSWNPADDATTIIKPLALAAPELSSVAAVSSEPRDIGMTRLSVQRDPLQPQTRLQVFAQVASTGQPQGDARLTLLVDGNPVLEKNVTPGAGAGAETLLTFSLPAPPHESRLIASVEPAGRDDLAADNTAYAVLPAVGESRVLLIGGSQGVDSGLERVLSLLPGVAVDVTRVSALPPSGAPGGYDLYLLDPEGDAADSAPLPVLPGNSIVFSARNGEFAAASESGGGSGEIVDWNRSHPVLRFADLTGASLRALPAWQTTGAWQPLIESRNGIVAAARDVGSGGGRSVQFSFSPRDSGFDKLSAFPILISNAIDWLGQTGGVGASATAGAPILLAPVSGGWAVTRESAGQSPVPVGEGLCDERDSPCSENETSLAGIYEAHSSGGTELFARSVDAGVTLAPQEHPLLPVFRANGMQAGQARRSMSTRSLLGAAGAVCLIALIIEWGVANAPRRLSRAAS